MGSNGQRDVGARRERDDSLALVMDFADALGISVKVLIDVKHDSVPPPRRLPELEKQKEDGLGCAARQTENPLRRRSDSTSPSALLLSSIAPFSLHPSPLAKRMPTHLVEDVEVLLRSLVSLVVLDLLRKTEISRR